jgi:hypothetical protein
LIEKKKRPYLLNPFGVDTKDVLQVSATCDRYLVPAHRHRHRHRHTHTHTQTDTDTDTHTHTLTHTTVSLPAHWNKNRVHTQKHTHIRQTKPLNKTSGALIQVK